MTPEKSPIPPTGSTRDANWFQNYEALKAYILKHGHLPNKHVVENRALY